MVLNVRIGVSVEETMTEIYGQPNITPGGKNHSSASSILSTSPVLLEVVANISGRLQKVSWTPEQESQNLPGQFASLFLGHVLPSSTKT